MNDSSDNPYINASERRRLAACMREFVPAVVLYVISIVVLVATIGEDEPTITNRLLVLLPLIPCLMGLRVNIRMLRRADEMTQAIQLQSIAVGFGAAMMFAIGMGLVSLPGEIGLVGQFAPWAIFSVGMLGWLISVGVLVSQRS